MVDVTQKDFRFERKELVKLFGEAGARQFEDLLRTAGQSIPSLILALQQQQTDTTVQINNLINITSQTTATVNNLTATVNNTNATINNLTAAVGINVTAWQNKLGVNNTFVNVTRTNSTTLRFTQLNNVTKDVASNG